MDPLSEALKRGKRQLRKRKPAPPPAANDAAAYERKKAAQARANATASAAAREIGPLPRVADPARRERCRADLLEFCRTYVPARFPLPFGPPHEAAAGRLQQCTEAGGLFALAMPRGSGKTTLAECEVIRALLYGLRRFALLVQATEALAAQSLAKIQRELEANDLLAADFPEVCYPVRRLERIHNRAKGQLLDGRPTRIEWTADGVRLPDVAGSPAAGGVLRVAGMTGAVRGLSTAGPGGEILRPDLVVIDDAQTRESARSPVQTAARRDTITDDVLGLAGPTRKIACVMLCTVIGRGDLSEQFLDREARPEWQGQRTRMLEQWPARMDLWERYADLRREELRAGGDGAHATAFYLQHRAEMDAGAVVSWPARRKPDEVSALQSALNLHIANPRGFRAEYQNEPEDAAAAAGAKELDPQAVAARLNGLPRLAVPREAARVVGFVDVGSHVHWYCVCALDPQFGGAVIDYGTWPRQPRAVFAADAVSPSLADVYPGGEDERVYAGLRDLTAEVMGRGYYRDGAGDELRCERLLIDCGWNSRVVHQFCRATPYAASVYPSKGVARTATALGVARWKPRPGELAGHHWRATARETGRGRMIQFDPDEWKTFAFHRLTTGAGGRGHLSLWGRSAAQHELFAEHCAAEAAEPMTVRGDTFDKWQVRPHRPDNHLFDCLVGCLVAGSVQGLVWSAAGDPPAPRARRRVSVEELYRQRQSEAGR